MTAAEYTKCAIMQPYFFPYLPYFQLIESVDTFVCYDDVNYIKRGWINRNNILSHGDGQRITLNLSSVSQNKLINQIEICRGSENFLKTLTQNYSKAPYFDAVYILLEDIISKSDGNLANYLDYGIKAICARLGIQTKIVRSSTLKNEQGLKGQDRILAICKGLNCSHYVNAIGGRSLYQSESFTKEGKSLSFLQARKIEYRQFLKPFVPNLSIIDVMMFNGAEDICFLLKEYDLV